MHRMDEDSFMIDQGFFYLHFPPFWADFFCIYDLFLHFFSKGMICFFLPLPENILFDVVLLTIVQIILLLQSPQAVQIATFSGIVLIRPAPFPAPSRFPISLIPPISLPLRRCRSRRGCGRLGGGWTSSSTPAASRTPSATLTASAPTAPPTGAVPQFYRILAQWSHRSKLPPPKSELFYVNNKSSICHSIWFHKNWIHILIYVFIFLCFLYLGSWFPNRWLPPSLLLFEVDSRLSLDCFRPLAGLHTSRHLGLKIFKDTLLFFHVRKTPYVSSCLARMYKLWFLVCSTPLYTYLVISLHLLVRSLWN